jgi:hypothetical protein
MIRYRYREHLLPASNNFLIICEAKMGSVHKWKGGGGVECVGQGVIKRCRISWLTNSALGYMGPNAGGGVELRSLSQ